MSIGSSPLTRGVVLVLLLSSLFGLLVWHGTLGPAPAMGAYPSAEDVAEDYDQYVGERVAIGGRVVETDPVELAADYGVNEHVRLRIIGLDPSISIEEGAILRVYGVLQKDETIQSINAFTVPTWGQWYTWTISFLAGLWVLSRIIRQWRFDTEEWGLVHRERLMGSGIREGEDNA